MVIIHMISVFAEYKLEIDFLCFTCSSLQTHGDPENQLIGDKHLMMPRRMSGGILNAMSIRTFKEKKTIYYPFSFIIYNTKPVGHQVVKCSLFSITTFFLLEMMLSN